jgi:drug/metabolite transporter (DMT)-like permease
MYRELTRVLALATILVGVAMIVTTARHGGGVGYFLGALFVLAGAGRLYLVGLRRRG